MRLNLTKAWTDQCVPVQAPSGEGYVVCEEVVGWEGVNAIWDTTLYPENPLSCKSAKSVHDALVLKNTFYDNQIRML